MQLSLHRCCVAWHLPQVKWCPNSVKFSMNGFWDTHERPYGGFVYVWLYDHVCVCTSLSTSLNLTAVSNPRPPAGVFFSDIIWDNEERDTWSLDSLTPLSLSVCTLQESIISQFAVASTNEAPGKKKTKFYLQLALLLHCWTVGMFWKPSGAFAMFVLITDALTLLIYRPLYTFSTVKSLQERFDHFLQQPCANVCCLHMYGPRPQLEN